MLLFGTGRSARVLPAAAAGALAACAVGWPTVAVKAGTGVEAIGVMVLGGAAGAWIGTRHLPAAGLRLLLALILLASAIKLLMA